MLVIPNYSLNGGHWNSSMAFQVGNATDGVCSEGGFTGGGPFGCPRSCPDRPYNYVGREWVDVVKFMRNLQAHGKAYYSINEYGDIENASAWKEPCTAEPKNCLTAAVRQWVLGSYLMAKEQAAGLFLSNIQKCTSQLPRLPSTFCAECLRCPRSHVPPTPPCV